MYKRQVYDTPHGVANAIILPKVMEFNAESTGERYKEIAKAMGVNDVDSMSQDAVSYTHLDVYKRQIGISISPSSKRSK